MQIGGGLQMKDSKINKAAAGRTLLSAQYDHNGIHTDTRKEVEACCCFRCRCHGNADGLALLWLNLRVDSCWENGLIVQGQQRVASY